MQAAVQLGSEEVEAEDGVVEVQGKEHFLDMRTCVEFCIPFLLNSSNQTGARTWADP